MNKEIQEMLELHIKNDIDLLPKNQKTVLDYITKLEKERDKYRMRCYKAHKMIFDNYGVLDKYGIDMLDDILTGVDDE